MNQKLSISFHFRLLLKQHPTGKVLLYPCYQVGKSAQRGEVSMFTQLVSDRTTAGTHRPSSFRHQIALSKARCEVIKGHS